MKMHLRGTERHSIAAAGLDVFHQEPLLSDHPFLKQENLVLTPHIAGITAELLKA